MGSEGIWNISIWKTGICRTSENEIGTAPSLAYVDRNAGISQQKGQQYVLTSTKHVNTMTKNSTCINPKQISLVTRRANLRDNQKQQENVLLQT